MSGKMITEFIHCILKERLNEDAGYSPKEIKVQQIHNLERFDKYGCEEENVSMRILKTDNIQRGTLL
ncbi:hypothetical protein [Chryseobacterium formosus]|nr:hypothetical protein [Chryseobacterium formosus]